ncbi:MAG: hypothetical protein QXF11_03640 [Candidatus Hadarchaeales archaeon]
MIKPLQPVIEIFYILAFVFLGLFTRMLAKGKKIEKPVEHFFESVNIFAVWAILPSIAFISIMKLETGEITGFLAAFLIGMFCSSVCLLLSILISFLRKESKEKILAISLNSGFMNVAYLGLPAVYAVLGSEYLAPAIAFALGVSILHVFIGTLLCNMLTGRGSRIPPLLARVFSFPAVFATIVAFFFLFFNIHISDYAIEFFDLYLSPVFLALMLLFTGYLLTVTGPRSHIRDLSRVSLFRFIIGPLATSLTLLLLGFDFKSALTPKAALLLSAMPPGTFNLILAKNFKLDVEYYGALMFHTTLIFVFLVLPFLSAFIL